MDKYIGESARLIREMFNYARDHQPCIIFMDEIDAIGKARGLEDGWRLFLAQSSYRATVYLLNKDIYMLCFERKHNRATWFNFLLAGAMTASWEL